MPPGRLRRKCGTPLPAPIPCAHLRTISAKFESHPRKHAVFRSVSPWRRGRRLDDRVGRLEETAAVLKPSAADLHNLHRVERPVCGARNTTGTDFCRNFDDHQATYPQSRNLSRSARHRDTLRAHQRPDKKKESHSHAASNTRGRQGIIPGISLAKVLPATHKP